MQLHLGVFHQVKLLEDVPLEGDQLFAGQVAGPSCAVERYEFRLARGLDAHTIFHQACKLQTAVGRTVDRVALHVKAQERGEVFWTLVVRAGHLDERIQVAHLVVFQKQEVQPGEALERAKVGDVVVAGGEGGQALEPGDAVELGDLVVVEVERPQLGQLERRREVADAVVREVERAHVAETLERLEILHAVVGQLDVLQRRQAGDRRDVLDLVLGEVEILDAFQVLDRAEVGDLVPGQVERGQRTALLETAQVLDAGIGRLDRGEVDQVGLEQRLLVVALGEDKLPHALLQRLVLEDRFRLGLGRFSLLLFLLFLFLLLGEQGRGNCQAKRQAGDEDSSGEIRFFHGLEMRGTENPKPPPRPSVFCWLEN